ncbi:MAG: hypothetical protein AABY22_24775 [Nanoarchaeota archaeon]
MEIKENDLRIGNWVSINNGIESTVEEIQYDFIGLCGNMVSNKIKDIKPIKLTPEWLIKFGFVCDIQTAEFLKVYPQDNWSLKVDCGVGFNLIKPRFDTGANWGALDNETYIICNESSIRVKYVHELQNVFFVIKKKELIYTAG